MDKTEKVRDSLLTLAESRTDLVAFIVGRRLDFLGGNHLAHALYRVIPGQPMNVALRMFLEPAERVFDLDWENRARGVAAYLRTAINATPDDAGLTELIGELSTNSSDFVRLWSEDQVAECGSRVRNYNHPLVGPLTLHEESLCVPDDPGQRINFMSAEPDSESARRLRRLAVVAL